MKMDRIKQRLRFAKEKLSFSTVLAKGKFVFKGKKIELSKLLNSCGKPWSASSPQPRPLHHCGASEASMFSVFPKYLFGDSG